MAAPVLAVGDGALGFWSAVREVFPETREQRCWWHKIGNVLNALPNSAQEEGARRDVERRGQGPRPSRGQRVRRRLRHQAAQGGRQDHRRPSELTIGARRGTCGPTILPVDHYLLSRKAPRYGGRRSTCEGPGPQGPATPSSRGILGFAR